MAAVATMTALYGAEKRGSGEHVDFSAFETIRGHIAMDFIPSIPQSAIMRSNS